MVLYKITNIFNLPVYFLRQCCSDSKSYFFQELQRRLDQTLGKPGSYLAGIDRSGNVKPMTIGARLYRLEQQVKFNYLNMKKLSFV